jgi:hypothetical protein
MIFWLFRKTIFPRNSVPFHSELRNGLFRGIRNSVGMSTFFRGITESVPRLFQGIPLPTLGHTCLREKGWESPHSDEGTYTVVLHENNKDDFLYTPKLNWAPVYNCIHWLRPGNSPPPPRPPAFGLIYESAIGQPR